DRPTREPTLGPGHHRSTLRSATCEATRSLECDLDTLRAAACSAHLAGHRFRLRPRRAQSSCRRRDPARLCVWRRFAARTAIGQGDHATGRRDGRRHAAAAHAEWIAPGVSREERRHVVHLDSVCPRSDRWALGYPRGPGVARSAGRFVTQRGDAGSLSREYDVRRGRRRHMLGARIAQRRQVHPRKERLTTAEQDRRDRDMHLVDEPRLEILAHRGRPAADLDIEPARGLPGATERFLNSAGDEMKDGPAFHRDRFARVVRQHEHRHVIRRVPGAAGPPPVRRARSRSCGRAVWTWKPPLVSYASSGPSRNRQAKDVVGPRWRPCVVLTALQLPLYFTSVKLEHRTIVEETGRLLPTKKDASQPK